MDAEAFQADIVTFARSDQPDRGDAEILEDLCAQADFAPFALATTRLLMGFATHCRAVAILVGHADGALAQVDDDAALLGAHRLRSAEHTSELQSRENLVCRLLLEK